MNFTPEKSKRHPRRKQPAKRQGGKWILRLYVAGKTQETRTAVNNLKLICSEQLNGNYQLKIIDLAEHPHLAREEQILAIPTLVRRSPLPTKNIIGDLSDTARVLAGLSLIDQNTMIGG